TLSADDRSALSQEFTKLLGVNNDIADRTAYGTLKILNGDSPESGFQIQSGAQAGEQDVVTTGNAELSALFGSVASDEGVADTVLMSTISGTLATAGTLGKIIQAYAVTTGTSDIADAADEILGSSREGQLNELGKNGAIGEVNIANFTKVLENDVANSGAFTDYSTVAAALTTTGLAADVGAVASTGFTDAQAATLNNFATDTLLDAMSSLITQVDKQRAKLGAEQNGLTSTVRNNTTAVVNVSDSRSRIQDTDFAAETAELTRNQIIQQASTTILSQANQLPQTALSLLR
uniref:flagellin n=1 Tax=Oceanospirillum sp. TaxID=2021254 RepID=UPI003A9529CD